MVHQQLARVGGVVKESGEAFAVPAVGQNLQGLWPGVPVA